MASKKDVEAEKEEKPVAKHSKPVPAPAPEAAENPDRGAEYFEVYSMHAKNMTYDGKPIPGWGELPEDTKSHWNAVADHAEKKIETSQTHEHNSG
jgi:hypothetical protein